jgi:hypothetical protein
MDLRWGDRALPTGALASWLRSLSQSHIHGTKQGYATQSEAESNTQHLSVGRIAGLNQVSRGPGKAAHRGLSSGSRRDVCAIPTQGRGAPAKGNARSSRSAPEMKAARERSSLHTWKINYCGPAPHACQAWVLMDAHMRYIDTRAKEDHTPNKARWAPPAGTTRHSHRCKTTPERENQDEAAAGPRRHRGSVFQDVMERLRAAAFQDVLECLSRGSAPRLNGWTYELLRASTSTAATPTTAELDLMNLLLSSCLPDLPSFHASSPIASEKLEGPGVLPIASKVWIRFATLRAMAPMHECQPVQRPLPDRAYPAAQGT